MDCVLSPIPYISISPAPPEESVPEPYSPFSSTFSPSTDEDAFRPQHLTPPPTHTRFTRQLSPLRPTEAATVGKGLEQERFQALLKATRDKNTLAGAKKAVDLRKEIALKAHKHKQVERRALFLSKVLAPPSPTATSTPKTPPDSPAIFHYTLPSPGLVSPLALFETLHDNHETQSASWVEQVDFRLSEDLVKFKRTTSDRPYRLNSKPSLPSLDQITAHLSSQGYGKSPYTPCKPSAPSNRPRLPVGVGRLQMPVRAPNPAPVCIPPPKSPSLLPAPRVTTTVVPRTATTSPTELSEINLLALNSRERRAHTMLSTLRRRTVPSECGPADRCMEDADTRRLRWKRRSAPADLMPLHGRSGFEHPVLALPGAF